MINKRHILPRVPSIFSAKAVELTRKGKSYLLKHLEHTRINKILAPNIALAVIAGTLIPASNTVFGNSNFTGVISNNKTLLLTSRGVENPVEPIHVNQGFFIFHPGVDLGGTFGEPIHPIMPGVVTDIQRSSFGYGNAIIIDHGNDTSSLYAHLSKIDVKLGDDVSQQTVIGLMGSTGHSTGTHLHLEIRENNVPQNPFNYLPTTSNLSLQ